MKDMKTLGKKIVIEPDTFDATENSAGIYIEQSSTDKMKHTKGVVTTIGSGVTEVTVGDHVMYSPLTFDEIEVEGATLHIVDEDDVFLILN